MTIDSQELRDLIDSLVTARMELHEGAKVRYDRLITFLNDTVLAAQAAGREEADAGNLREISKLEVKLQELRAALSRAALREPNELTQKLDRVSRWIDKFPVPTDGATAMMCLLRDVKESIEAHAAAQGAVPQQGCPKCGSTEIHACPGSPIPEWTPEKIEEMNRVLSKYETDGGASPTASLAPAQPQPIYQLKSIITAEGWLDVSKTVYDANPGRKRITYAAPPTPVTVREPAADYHDALRRVKESIGLGNSMTIHGIARPAAASKAWEVHRPGQAEIPSGERNG